MVAQILTATEVADRLKLSLDTVYALARQGILPGVKLGGQWRFDAVHVQRLFETPTSESAPTSSTQPNPTEGLTA